MARARAAASAGAPAVDPPPVAEVYPWQKRQWRTLTRQRGAGRLPHALLLHGRQGLGKADFARALAHACLCAGVDGEGIACGQCRGCRLFLAGNHPDVQFLRPPAGGKFILVDAVRATIARLGATSQYPGPKVLVMDDAQRMNAASANAFLKTLEEPPGDSLLILVSARPDGLPATIRSRCQQVHFGAAAPVDSMPWLEARLAGLTEPANATGAEDLLGIAGGAPLAALALARSGALGWRRQAFGEFRDLRLGRSDPLQVAERWSKCDLDELLHWVLSWSRDMIRCHGCDSAPYLDNPDLAHALRELARSSSLIGLYAHLDRSLAARRGLAAANLNPQLLCEDLLITWRSAGRR